ncbi:MAG: metal ABC transporter substrate-binding protein [Infirmifilum uzonense]|uniref:metal ABC transporter substrate-binding protein n=1 Tax=Infirmifilum uzonense TaxID=1550241 RepID=UPI003C76EC67
MIDAKGDVHINRGRLVFIILVALLLLVFSVYLLTQGKRTSETKSGLNIAVTFYSLKPDLDLLVCEGDNVFSITPAGVDPHEYQLSPADIEKLKQADLIVSTAHTPFETQIHELVTRGELKAVLIEIPEIPQIKIRNNPMTGQPNYHWPIYDPDNYKVYLSYVESKLEDLRSNCKSTYKSHLTLILNNITRIQDSLTPISVCAVATSPPVQYAVEWTGVKVKYLLQKEEDLPATPQDIASIEQSLASGECKLIVIVGSTSTPLAQKALELSGKYKVKYIVIPSPISPQSTLSKINEVVKILNSLKY